MIKLSEQQYIRIFEVIVNDLAGYLRKYNLKSMVLGVSGGIDSTLVAAVCYEVVKRNPDLQFYGVGLPCSTNSDEENSSAVATMKAFCKDGFYWTQNLQEVYEHVEKVYDNSFVPTPISTGNLKARLRMMYLYNVAGVFKGIVMDTDNLTEHYLGFYTIHGDQGDYKPIGSLWKHEVYELTSALYNSYFTDEAQKEALHRALVITPTDGNGVQAGGDMAQIAPGHTYEEVDDILAAYLSAVGKHPEWFQIEKQSLYDKYGFETVERVISRHTGSAFKRNIEFVGTKREDMPEIGPSF